MLNFALAARPKSVTFKNCSPFWLNKIMFPESQIAVLNLFAPLQGGHIMLILLLVIVCRRTELKSMPHDQFDQPTPRAAFQR